MMRATGFTEMGVDRFTDWYHDTVGAICTVVDAAVYFGLMKRDVDLNSDEEGLIVVSFNETRDEAKYYVKKLDCEWVDDGEAELKECPFCGSNDTVMGGLSGGAYNPRCNKCGAHGGHWSERSEAVETWNEVSYWAKSKVRGE
jgi:hypothetical protein